MLHATVAPLRLTPRRSRQRLHGRPPRLRAPAGNQPGTKQGLNVYEPLVGLLPVSASPSAVVLVRNTAVNDGRVLRAARVLERIGHRPVVLGVTSASDTAPAVTVDGVQVLRLTPRSPFELARQVFRAPGGGGKPLGAGAEGSADRGWPSPLMRLHRLLRTLDYYRRAIGLLR